MPTKERRQLIKSARNKSERKERAVKKRLTIFLKNKHAALLRETLPDTTELYK